MKKVFIYLMILVFPLSIYSQDIELTISLNKNEYLLGESIWMRVNLTNNRKDSVYVNLSEIINAAYLENSSGNRIPSNVTISFWRPNRPDTGPGVTRKAMADIVPYFARHDTSLKMRLFDVDNYSIYVFYDNKAVVSNTVNFSVVEPEGIEKEVFKQYKEGYNLWFKKKENIKAASHFEELAEKYSNSVYAPEALNVSANAYNIGKEIDLQKSISAYKKILFNYPNSYQCKNAASGIENLMRSINDREGYINLMEEVINTLPGTKASGYCIRRLEYARTAPDDKWSYELETKKIREESKRLQELQKKKRKRR
ncbi:MAG: hypothetical protein DRP89_00735 [Candidatus Neomarinimicrobiota bacterium]|nr:MAG: hypothetical protein DRP89_00735 [Candidatus Neomarinimicrobiota bacterium]